MYKEGIVREERLKSQISLLKWFKKIADAFGVSLDDLIK